MRLVRDEMISAALALGPALLFAVSLELPGFGILRFVAGSAILVFFTGHLLRAFARVVFRKTEAIRLLSPPGLALDFLASLGILTAIAAVLMITFTFREEALVEVVLGLVVGLAAATLLVGGKGGRRVASTPTIGTAALWAVAMFQGWRGRWA